MDTGALPPGWPLDPRALEPREVPLFPLPGVFLVPGTFMPLHVFEPRYRQMVEDCLDGPGRIAMGTVLPGYERELAGSPPVHHVAGLGEIVKHQRLADGRFLIVLFGLTRASIREAPSTRLYRKVLAEPLPDQGAGSARANDLRPLLVAAVQARNTEIPEIPEHLGLGHVVDLLLLQMKLPPERMLALFSERDVVQRAEGALAEHRARPIEPPGEEDGGGESRELI